MFYDVKIRNLALTLGIVFAAGVGGQNFAQAGDEGNSGNFMVRALGTYVAPDADLSVPALIG